jgi:hypothetical protein
VSRASKQDKEEEEKRRLLTRSVPMESIKLKEDWRWRVDVRIVRNVRQPEVEDEVQVHYCEHLGRLLSRGTFLALRWSSWGHLLGSKNADKAARWRGACRDGTEC